MAYSFPTQEGYFPLLLTANALEFQEELENNSNNRSMSLSDLDNTEDSAQTINHDVNLHDATPLGYYPTTINAEKKNMEVMDASALSCRLAISNTSQFPSSSLLGIFSSDINDWNLTNQDLLLGMDTNGFDEVNLTSLTWAEDDGSLEASCLSKDSDSESSLSLDLTHSSLSFDFTCDSDTEYLIYDLGMVGRKYSQYGCTDHQSHYGQGAESLVNVFHDHTYSQSSDRKASSMSENDIWLEKLSKGTTRNLSNINRNPSHNEYCAKALRIPFAINDIVTLPVDSFNSMLSKYCLTDNQLSLIRDIRRRGKNKVAAQNCRKRKLDVIMNLKDDVCHLQTEKEKLKRQKTKRNRSISSIKQKINFLCWDIFSRLGGDKGISVN